MSTVTILVKGISPAIDLGAFASQVSAVLRDCTLAERESSNYAAGHYFKGSLGNAEVTLYYFDTEGFEQYPFAIEVSATEEVALKAAQDIAKAGFSCFVPAGAWYRKSWNGEGKTYEF